MQQYYASNGLRTCLLIQSQDPTADVLLGVKLNSTPSSFREGALTALRLETTKVCLLAHYMPTAALYYCLLKQTFVRDL